MVDQTNHPLPPRPPSPPYDRDRCASHSIRDALRAELNATITQSRLASRLAIARLRTRFPTRLIAGESPALLRTRWPLIPAAAMALAMSAAAAAATASASSLVLTNRTAFAGSAATSAPGRLNGGPNLRSRTAVSCVRASTSEPSSHEPEAVTRRQALGGAAAVAAVIATFGSPALALNAPKGYTAVLDNADGYKFFYPFGWQEVAVKGQDVAFKDVIEPLESVSVSIIKTDKSTLAELGTPDEVAKALVERVLASPTQKTQLVEAKERSSEGNTYYTFEFLSKAQNFTRHGLGAVAIKDGKFFTMTTGSNERRWNKMSDKLKMVINSFELLV